eukprot:364927-Chlamydomonas_euryale.AAC.22
MFSSSVQGMNTQCPAPPRCAAHTQCPNESLLSRRFPFPASTALVTCLSPPTWPGSSTSLPTSPPLVTHPLAVSVVRSGGRFLLGPATPVVLSAGPSWLPREPASQPKPAAATTAHAASHGGDSGGGGGSAHGSAAAAARDDFVLLYAGTADGRCVMLEMESAPTGDAELAEALALAKDGAARVARAQVGLAAASVISRCPLDVCQPAQRVHS